MSAIILLRDIFWIKMSLLSVICKDEKYNMAYFQNGLNENTKLSWNTQMIIYIVYESI